MKDIRIERFLCNLLFIGFQINIQGDGLRVEEKETDVTNVAGIAPFHKQRNLYYSVLRNLLSTVCARIHTFCVNFISDSYSAVQIVYLYQSTNQDITPLKSRTVLSQCHTCF